LDRLGRHTFALTPLQWLFVGLSIEGRSIADRPGHHTFALTPLQWLFVGLSIEGRLGHRTFALILQQLPFQWLHGEVL
jgi:hypothetical protein